MPGGETICAACGMPPFVPDGAEAAPEGLPAGWHLRKLGRRSFLLCDVCGDIQHFKGGVSSYLQDALGIGPYAYPDFSAPEAGLHRLRRKAAAVQTPWQDDPVPDDPEKAGP